MSYHDVTAQRREIMIATIADLLEGVRHVAIGASSPIPAAGAMLLRERNRRSGKPSVRISVLGSRKNNFFTNGGVELFDCAAQGRVDAFFLGGGQIDGEANINLVGSGEYPRSEVRWPGSFGSAYLYFLVPRIILFREEHSTRVFVKKVDFISAPGVSDQGVDRKGGPRALLTGMALFDFDKERRRFDLKSVHPGYSLDDVKNNTGFDYGVSSEIAETASPDEDTRSLLHGPVLESLSETYPEFARTMSVNASSRPK